MNRMDWGVPKARGPITGTGLVPRASFQISKNNLSHDRQYPIKTWDVKPDSDIQTHGFRRQTY